MVMDNLSFPFFCSDWNADEEILLLEGIEMYGLANGMRLLNMLEPNANHIVLNIIIPYI